MKSTNNNNNSAGKELPSPAEEGVFYNPTTTTATSSSSTATSASTSKSKPEFTVTIAPAATTSSTTTTSATTSAATTTTTTSHLSDNYDRPRRYSAVDQALALIRQVDDPAIFEGANDPVTPYVGFGKAAKQRFESYHTNLTSATTSSATQIQHQQQQHQEIVINNDLGPGDEKDPLLSSISASSEKTVVEDHGSGTWKTVLVIFKSFVGTGILFLPKAFTYTGIVGAVMMFSMIGVLATWCMLLLLKVADKLEDEGHKLKGLGDVAVAVWGKKGQFIIDVILVMTQVLFSSVYVVFIAETWREAVHDNDWFRISIEEVILIQLPFLVPLVFIRKLKYFAPTNLLADAIIIITLIYIVAHDATKLHEDGMQGKAVLRHDYLLMFGVAVFAFEGMAMIVPIQQSMVRKKDMPRVLTLTMIFVVSLVCFFGFLNYITYGDDLESIVLLNLSKEAGTAIKIVYPLAVFFTIPLFLYPVNKIIHDWCNLPDRNSPNKWYKNGINTVVLIITVGLALAGSDNIEYFVGLVGALFSIPLAFFIPTYFHFKVVCYDPTQPLKIRKDKMVLGIMDYTIMIFGVFACIVSAFTVLEAWVNPSDYSDYEE